MASRAAALDLRVALDTTGSSRRGRPTETGKSGQAERTSSSTPGRCPGPRGFPSNPGKSGLVCVSFASLRIALDDTLFTPRPFHQSAAD